MPETIKETDARIKSFYLNKVPILPVPLAIALCITNCILPGIGKFITVSSLFLIFLPFLFHFLCRRTGVMSLSHTETLKRTIIR